MMASKRAKKCAARPEIWFCLFFCLHCTAVCHRCGCAELASS